MGTTQFQIHLQLTDQGLRVTVINKNKKKTWVGTVGILKILFITV